MKLLNSIFIIETHVNVTKIIFFMLFYTVKILPLAPFFQQDKITFMTLYTWSIHDVILKTNQIIGG